MTGLRAHFFQHVPFEGLGSMEDWLVDNGYAISSTGFFDPGYRLPGIGEVDLLIVMGGPMSVNDEGKYPWLAAEKTFIAEFIATGKPVLGICLGAQLIAQCQGARVYPNPEPEIGWYPVYRHGETPAGVFSFPAECLAFHWHGETFDLPPGAVPLAGSHACENQAFQLGDNVIGLQCHLETIPDSARALVKHCGHELAPADFVQSAGQILFAPSEHYQAINALAGEILTFLTGRGSR